MAARFHPPRLGFSIVQRGNPIHHRLYPAAVPVVGILANRRLVLLNLHQPVVGVIGQVIAVAAHNPVCHVPIRVIPVLLHAVQVGHRVEMVAVLVTVAHPNLAAQVAG